MLQLSDSINVWAFFRNGNLEPHTFIWKQRKIKIDQINLVHTTKDTSSLQYHFSVSSGGNFYRLGFDPRDLKWFLEAVEED